MCARLWRKFPIKGTASLLLPEVRCQPTPWRRRRHCWQRDEGQRPPLRQQVALSQSAPAPKVQGCDREPPGPAATSVCTLRLTSAPGSWLSSLSSLPSSGALSTSCRCPRAPALLSAWQDGQRAALPISAPQVSPSLLCLGHPGARQCAWSVQTPLSPAPHTPLCGSPHLQPGWGAGVRRLRTPATAGSRDRPLYRPPGYFYTHQGSYAVSAGRGRVAVCLSPCQRLLCTWPHCCW